MLCCITLSVLKMKGNQEISKFASDQIKQFVIMLAAICCHAGSNLLSYRQQFVIMQAAICCHAGSNLLSCRQQFVDMQAAICFMQAAICCHVGSNLLSLQAAICSH